MLWLARYLGLRTRGGMSNSIYRLRLTSEPSLRRGGPSTLPPSSASLLPMTAALNAGSLLTPDAMRRLSALALRSRYVVEGSRAGQHASPLKGASVEFADHRTYVKGDNLRQLDWKVLGRTERLYVKQFREETNLRVHILLDVSGSMAFRAGGRPTKHAYGCGLAAALGYIITVQQDSLGLCAFDRVVRAELPARSGSRHFRFFLDELARHEPQGGTDTGFALHALAERLARRGLVILISDLFDDADTIFRALAHFRKKRHDVIVFQVLDPAELELDVPRGSELVDLETGEKMEVDADLVRREYKRVLGEVIARCRENCARLGVDHRLVSTAEDREDFVRHYLDERRRIAA